MFNLATHKEFSQNQSARTAFLGIKGLLELLSLGLKVFFSFRIVSIMKFAKKATDSRFLFGISFQKIRTHYTLRGSLWAYSIASIRCKKSHLSHAEEAPELKFLLGNHLRKSNPTIH